MEKNLSLLTENLTFFGLFFFRLILYLEFSGILTSADIKWSICIKYNYLKNAYFKRIPNNIEVTFDPH